MHRTQYSLCADVVFGFCLIIYYFLLEKIIIMRRRSYLGLRTRRGRITGKEYLTKNWCRRRGSLIISRLQARKKKNAPDSIFSSPFIALSNGDILQTCNCKDFENRRSWGFSMALVRGGEMQPNFQQMLRWFLHTTLQTKTKRSPMQQALSIHFIQW